MDSNFIRFILIILFSPVFLFLFHLVSVRIIIKTGKKISMQKLVFFCILFFNIPLFITFFIFLGKETAGLDYFYIFLVYNAIGYFYFHCFNMSETARRIKLLLGIKKGCIKKSDDIANYYKYKDTLEIRLKRLEELGQIERKNRGYATRGKLFVAVAYLVVFFRKILGFE